MKFSIVMLAMSLVSISSVAGILPAVEEGINDRPSPKYHHWERRSPPAAGASPCLVADNELMDEVYGHNSLPSRDVVTVESCAESKKICVPTMDGTVLTANTPADLKGLGKEWEPVFALVQITDQNQSICLVVTNIYDGGEEWEIHGWRINSNKAIEIQDLPSIELSSGSANPYDLVTKTINAYSKSHK